MGVGTSTGMGAGTNQNQNTTSGTTPPASASTTTPPAATSPGADYLKQVRDRMAGKDPVVQNATNHNQHAKAVQDYLAQSRARMTSSQAGFDVGTLQHQRVQDREQANAAQANRASDQQLGDLMRARGAETMTLARDVEQQEQKYINDLIASYSDNPGVQMYLRRVHANGGDVRAAHEGMYGEGEGGGSAGGGAGGGDAGTPDGTTPGGTGTGTPAPGQGYRPGELRPEFRPQTPAEIELQAIKDDLAVRGTPADQIDALAMQTYTQRQQDKEAEANAERQTLLETTARKIVANGRFDQLTPEQRTAFLESLPEREASSLPRNPDEVSELLKGKSDTHFVKVNGTPYQIVGSYTQTTERNKGFKDNRHAEWVQVKDLNTGKDAWVNKDGMIVNSKPPGPRERGKHVEYDATRGVWVETYQHSGGRTGRYYDSATRSWRKL